MMRCWSGPAGTGWTYGAVDAEGEFLDIFLQPKRDKKAAMKLMRAVF